MPDQSSAVTTPVEPVTAVSGPAAAPARTGRRWLPPVAMLVALAVGALLPLRTSRIFYYWDDTAGAAVGVWQRIAEDVLSGQLPMLQIDMWRGGNFAAEAATGFWNPVMLFLMLVTHPLDNVALAITLSKFVLLGILALGVYFLAREYGAKAWPAAAIGVALGLSGYTLYMDATSWINGLAISAFTPWMWWAVRRNAYGRGSVLLALLAGYLLVSTGNPYGMLALGAVLAAVGVEMIFVGRARRIWWLACQLAIALFAAVIVYLPFLLTSSVGSRAGSETGNDEFLAPGLSDLLGMSTPGFQPYIGTWGLPFMTFPGLYLAWFVLPLLPWLKWSNPSSWWKRVTGVLAFGVFYLLLVLGPSQIWMFRWPARLLPFLWLAVMVLFAVLLSKGIARDRLRLRWILTGAIILLGGWQAYADRPDNWKWVGFSVVLVAVLMVVLLRTAPEKGRGFGVLSVGLLVVLFFQTMWMPVNANVANYQFPQSRSEMESNFEGRYEGLTVQIGSIYSLPPGTANPEGAWKDMLYGEMYSLSGVESTTAYTGIGINAHDAALCFNYFGATCPAAWDSLWEVPEGETETLADLLRVETVVVQNDFVEDLEAPEGWHESDETEFVTVFRRDEAAVFPEGRVSVAGEGVTVESDISSGDVHEELVVSTGAQNEDRQLTFSRLAWPGYTVTVDGAEVEPELGPAGLLRIELPANLEGADVVVSFEPPGWRVGLTALAVGLLGAAAMAVIEIASRRRRPMAANMKDEVHE